MLCLGKFYVQIKVCEKNIEGWHSYSKSQLWIFLSLRYIFQSLSKNVNVTFIDITAHYFLGFFFHFSPILSFLCICLWVINCLQVFVSCFILQFHILSVHTVWATSGVQNLKFQFDFSGTSPVTFLVWKTLFHI